MRTGYQTNNINVDEIDEILEEIETAGLDNPKIKCCICERERNRPMLYIPCLRSGAMRDGWHCICWVRLHGPNRWTSRRWCANMGIRSMMCFASTAG